jgi:hypothetical protein
MGLFKKKNPPESALPQPSRYGPGRRFSSENDPVRTEQALSNALTINSPTPYEHMKPLHNARVTWHGDGSQPTAGWSCSYGSDEKFVFTVWPSGSGSEVGFFPLGGSEESLGTPLIGQWKQLDPSLQSIGRFESGLLTLNPPQLTDSYYNDTLTIAQKSVTDMNRMVLIEQTALMFVLKAQGYIAGTDPRGADDHAWNGDLAMPQRILDDMAQWNHGVVPYLQDLPWRVRGILLEPNQDGVSTAEIWKKMS